jgi:glycosyltransferase involved in cell wall biosynthesis
MRILKVTQSYFPFQDRGGTSTKVRAIATMLAARGHDVTVLTADLGLTSEETVSLRAKRTKKGWQSFHESVETIYLPTWSAYRSLTINPGVRNFCRSRLREFDVVQIYGIYDLLGPVVARHCLRQNIPYFVETMGMFRPIVRNIRLKQVYHGFLGSNLLSKSRYIIATSVQERKELIDGGIREGKVVIRRNGVAFPDQLPARGSFRRLWNIGPEKKIILFLGRLVSKKAPDLLLKAFAAYRNQDNRSNQTILVLAGPEPDAGYRKKLDSLSLSLGVSNCVLFPGALYDDSKWAAFRDADVFVLPSQNENFGNTVAEAVACQTPVILTDRCGIAPAIKGRAGIVIPFDEGALQNALADVLNDNNLCDQMRSYCPTVAKELSWQEPLEIMEGLYHGVVGQNDCPVTAEYSHAQS